MKELITQVGDPVLRQIAKPVSKKDFGSRKLHKIIERMKTALKREEFGVALAAPQIGESLRIFVVAPHVFEKLQADEEKSGASFAEGEARTPRTFLKQPGARTTFINPEITRMSRKSREMSEGCLSVRGKYGTVMRHEKATLRAYDENGEQFTYHASGLIAHIFQHEMDHLEGILYIDSAIKLQDEGTREELRVDYPA